MAGLLIFASIIRYLYIVALTVFASFLVTLVASDRGFSAAWSYFHNNESVVFALEMLLLLTTGWLLIGVPDQAYKSNLDRNGEGCAQRVLIGKIAAIACVLTGIYLYMFHYAGGPLVAVHGGPLIVGIFLTVVLLWPFYKSLARACWRHGYPGFLIRGGLKKSVGDLASEIRPAVDRYFETMDKSESVKPPESIKTEGSDQASVPSLFRESPDNDER